MIDEVGAGGDYLGEEHTLRYMRTEFAANTISDRHLARILGGGWGRWIPRSARNLKAQNLLDRACAAGHPGGA